MDTQRLTGYAPRTTALARQLAALHSPCVGCKDCRGLCRDLIEALTLPDTVLRTAD